MTTLLRFQGGPMGGQTVINTGPWPPAQRIAVVPDLVSGALVQILDGAPPEVEENLPEDVAFYRLVEWSEVPPDPAGHFAPGATYVQEVETIEQPVTRVTPRKTYLRHRYVTGPQAGTYDYVGPFDRWTDAVSHQSRWGPIMADVVEEEAPEPVVSPEDHKEQVERRG